MAISRAEMDKLEPIFGGIEEQGDAADITKWERDFVADQKQRVDTYGERTFLSAKQWDILDRVYDKVIGE